MDGESALNRFERLGTAPLARALALSAALHAAVLMVVQPAPGGRAETLVINARLLPPAPRPEALPEAPLPTPEPPLEAEPAPTPPVAPIARAPEPEAVTVPTPAAPAAPAEAPVAPVQPASPGPVQPEAVAGAAGARDTSPGLPRIPVMLDSNWYTARQVDERPRLLESRLPRYPEEARRKGIEGSVVVQVHIDQFGKVREIEIIESDPPGVFDDAVRVAYEGAPYAPAVLGGQPVRYIGKYRVRFELD
jgi:protein TonB